MRLRSIVQRLRPVWLLAFLGLLFFGSSWTGRSFQLKLKSPPIPVVQDGDIVLQTSISPQCSAIREATQSEWTHCGIVFMENGNPMVLEAVGPVRKTSLKEWLGRTGHWTIRRLKDGSKLTDEAKVRMRAVGEEMLGKDYDTRFLWNDDEIYCSELVWKIYQNGAGVEVGEVEKWGSMKLDGPAAHRIIAQRFPNGKLPVDEPVVTPASIARSGSLEEVGSK
ncbi:MAG: YiiX/YebB-like N1pC/P60 family cysteine hydrolase [Flavobacteriales bacterium]